MSWIKATTNDRERTIEMITIELKRLTDRIAMLERGIDRAVACCEAERKWRKRLQKRIADIEQDQRINDGDEK